MVLLLRTVDAKSLTPAFLFLGAFHTDSMFSRTDFSIRQEKSPSTKLMKFHYISLEYDSIFETTKIETIEKIYKKKQQINAS